MIVLSKEQIEEMVDPDQMMDQIEEAYRIYGSGEFYMPPRPTVEHENKQLMYMPCYTKDIIGTKILSFSRRILNWDCRREMVSCY